MYYRLYLFILFPALIPHLIGFKAKTVIKRTLQCFLFFSHDLVTLTTDRIYQNKKNSMKENQNHIKVSEIKLNYLVSLCVILLFPSIPLIYWFPNQGVKQRSPPPSPLHNYVYSLSNYYHWRKVFCILNYFQWMALAGILLLITRYHVIYHIYMLSEVKRTILLPRDQCRAYFQNTVQWNFYWPVSLLVCLLVCPAESRKCKVGHYSLTFRNSSSF